MASLLVLLASCRLVRCNVPLWGFLFVAEYLNVRLLVKVCMAVFQLLSDGQVAAGYVPYGMFETCKHERSVRYRRRRDSFVEGRIGGSKFKLDMAREGRSGGLPMRY